MEEILNKIKELSEAYDKAPEAGISCKRMLDLKDVTNIFENLKFDPDEDRSLDGYTSRQCILLSNNIGDEKSRCRANIQQDMKMYIILNTLVIGLREGLLEDMQCVVESK